MPLEPARELAGLDLGGATAGAVLRETNKTLLLHGERDGRPVAIKVLREDADDEGWARLAREVDTYRALHSHPAPVRTPALLATDDARVLVTEWLPGRVLDPDRYPARALTRGELDAMLSAVTGFGGWCPPPGTLAPVLDYPSRIEAYRAAGYLSAADRAGLLDLLDATPTTQAPAHGDPLPSNLLLTPSGPALVDFEFTGSYLPGFDLAILAVLLAATPAARGRIAEHVERRHLSAPFLINRALVLARERRIHHELDPSLPLRRSRLALLDQLWQHTRAELHRGT